MNSTFGLKSAGLKSAASAGRKVSKTAKTPGSGKEVSFSLDPENGVPIYRQIIQQIEYAILSGRMRPGDRLPTIRSLAVELKTNPNTIAKAYGELEILGILETHVGSGTYISEKKPIIKQEDSLGRKIREVTGRFVQEMRDLGVDKKELVKLVAEFKE
jgi:GntR family transcriptional regulator